MLGQGSRYCGMPLLTLAGADHSETHSKETVERFPVQIQVLLLGLIWISSEVRNDGMPSPSQAQ